jgi:hypothetical protein
MEAEGKNGKMSGSDSAISVRESREERFEEFALNRDRGDSRLSSPPTPPDMRVRIRRFGGLS